MDIFLTVLGWILTILSALSLFFWLSFAKANLPKEIRDYVSSRRALKYFQHNTGPPIDPEITKYSLKYCMSEARRPIQGTVFMIVLSASTLYLGLWLALFR